MTVTNMKNDLNRKFNILLTMEAVPICDTTSTLMTDGCSNYSMNPPSVALGLY